jgi:hypothetical protein
VGFERNDDHPYQHCTDEDCPRFPCRVYKEGQRNGYDGGTTLGFDGWHVGYRVGWADGYAEGYAAGYGAGYSAGVAAAA